MWFLKASFWRKTAIFLCPALLLPSWRGRLTVWCKLQTHLHKVNMSLPSFAQSRKSFVSCLLHNRIAPWTHRDHWSGFVSLNSLRFFAFFFFRHTEDVFRSEILTFGPVWTGNRVTFQPRRTGRRAIFQTKATNSKSSLVLPEALLPLFSLKLTFWPTAEAVLHRLGL